MNFFCLGQFYCFLMRVMIVVIKKGSFAAFKTKIIFIVFDGSK